MKPPFLSKEDLIEKMRSNAIELSPLLIKAFAQAGQSHATQRRDDGSSYLEQHIYPLVADLIEACRGTECIQTMLAAALLHDVLEDDPAVDEEVFRREFGEEVYGMVKLLTKSPTENSPALSEVEKLQINRAVVGKIKKTQKPVKLIKLADRVNNFTSYILCST